MIKIDFLLYYHLRQMVPFLIAGHNCQAQLHIPDTPPPPTSLLEQLNAGVQHTRIHIRDLIFS